MEELKWPVEICENCFFLLARVEAKPKDKTGLSSDGQRKPMWTDYCPRCGKGYQVGYVNVPKPHELTELKPIITLPSPDKELEELELEGKTESEGEAQSMKISQVLKQTEETAPIPSQNAPSDNLACPTCNKVCKNLAGLSAHQRIVHPKEVANAISS